MCGGPIAGESCLRRAAPAGDPEAAALVADLYAREGALPPPVMPRRRYGFRGAAAAGQPPDRLVCSISRGRCGADSLAALAKADRNALDDISVLAWSIANQHPAVFGPVAGAEGRSVPTPKREKAPIRRVDGEAKDYLPGAKARRADAILLEIERSFGSLSRRRNRRPAFCLP